MEMQGFTGKIIAIQNLASVFRMFGASLWETDAAYKVLKPSIRPNSIEHRIGIEGDH